MAASGGSDHGDRIFLIPLGREPQQHHHGEFSSVEIQSPVASPDRYAHPLDQLPISLETEGPFGVKIRRSQSRWRSIVERPWILATVVGVAVLVLAIAVVVTLISLGSASNVSVTDPYRTAFHFQPTKNWMNDPNGPLYYKGLYHLFYQYNPMGAVWGNIHWGHAVSRDLLRWEQLPIVLVPDRWYDEMGVWSGSATLLEDGTPIVSYTGVTRELMQVQNLAVPKDPADPLLREWVKLGDNPVIRPPPEVNSRDFRDPTTAWQESDGMWRMLVGSRRNGSGAAELYKSSNFRNWTRSELPLHSVQGTVMWECPDFYPVGSTGLNFSNANPESNKYLLKVSLDHTLLDYYVIGTFNATSDTWQPDDPLMDIGKGLRYDYGKYYASKSFFDTAKQRRIVWGWVYETDSRASNIQRGWASLQALPRVVTLEAATGALLQWPVEELLSLRQGKGLSYGPHNVTAGAVVDLPGVTGSQLDLELTFARPVVGPAEVSQSRSLGRPFNASCHWEGAARQGVVGPFGVTVLAGGGEETHVYFEMLPDGNGTWTALSCTDLTRSSVGVDVDRGVYGSVVLLQQSETAITARVIVDHSIVEVYAQGGRTCTTTRVYPRHALLEGGNVRLFNNGSIPITVLSAKAWNLASAVSE